jgi:hypothetical protein
MKAAKVWCVAALVVVAGLSASCGKDEANGPDGMGGLIMAGSGGVAGGLNQGRAGSSAGGIVGVAGSGSGTSGTKLGRGCLDDKDCEDTNAPGMVCLTAKDPLPGGNGAPPKGMCTAPCTMPTEDAPDDTCAAFGNGMCYPFDSSDNVNGYCVESCGFGPPALGEDPKCHNRAEFACNPALLADLGDPCTTTDDCQTQEICLEGDSGTTCHLVIPACLPACKGDLDCESGMYCDMSFLNGTCVTEKPTGKALGEPCTVPGDDEPDEPDECLGFCQADESGSTQGHCSATCALGYDCSFNSATEKFDGACFYPSVLTADNPAAGDFGFCTPACNCSSECNDAALACLSIPQIPLDDNYRGPGLCFSPDDQSEELTACGAGGADGGGTGGSPSGDAGAGGAG